MKKMIIRIALVLVLLVTMCVPATLSVYAKQPKVHVELPFEETGTLNNADYRIRVPDNWNGTLLVYAHGYYAELPTTPVQIAPGWGTAVEDTLLGLGFGLAGSSFRDGGLGWAVKEGTQNMLALTNYFKGQVGKPKHVIIWGCSMGSVIALKSIEKYPGIYDGAVAESGLNAGTPMQFDYMLATRLAYAVAFGWDPNWGEVGDLRDDLDFFADVFPTLAGQLGSPEMEFVELVVDYPEEAFYPAPSPFDSIPWLIISFMFAFGPELEIRAKGNGVQNLDHVYSLTQAEIDYLTLQGVDAPSLLAVMNDMTNIEASTSARKYLERYAEYSGDITGPVITLHNREDPLCHVSHNAVYRDTVEEAGNADLLLQVFTNWMGHAAFTNNQYVMTVVAMQYWLDTGIRPDPPDSTHFPAAEGFIPGFVIPDWPFSD